MYIYTDDATQLNPLPPCSNVHYCPSVHYCTDIHYCSGVHLVPVVGRVRELVICFVMRRCIRIAIHIVIHLAIALHMVEGFYG